MQDGRATDAAADSGLLVGQVTVAKEGTGRGLVSSSPGGITCGGTCLADFAGPSLVTLSATPDSDSLFAGWSGACQGAGACVLNVSTTHVVTARFVAREHSLGIRRTGAGRGSVTSFPIKIDCGAVCTTTYETGLTVVLSAAAESDSIFAGWSGACSGMEGCSLVLDDDKVVTARFEPVIEGLQIGKSGTGAGRVTSLPSGIDCGDLCAASFALGSTITLLAKPEPTSTFSGWSGLCHGSDACVLRMSSAGSVTAGFELIQYGLSLDKTGTGNGSIHAAPAGIASANSCAANYPAGTLVTLSATPDETSVFTGWSGACSGTGVCSVIIDGAQTVSANFEAIRRRLSLTKAGTGNGLVTSVPSGISCGDACAADFVLGSHVVLVATPMPGSTFAGWSGACAGSENCTVVMDTDRSVAASFR